MEKTIFIHYRSLKMNSVYAAKKKKRIDGIEHSTGAGFDLPLPPLNQIYYTARISLPMRFIFLSLSALHLYTTPISHSFCIYSINENNKPGRPARARWHTIRRKKKEYNMKGHLNLLYSILPNPRSEPIAVLRFSFDRIHQQALPARLAHWYWCASKWSVRFSFALGLQRVVD